MQTFGVPWRCEFFLTLWTVLCFTMSDVLTAVSDDKTTTFADGSVEKPIYTEESLVYGEVLSPDCYGCVLFLGRNATRPKLTEIVCKYNKHEFFLDANTHTHTHTR